MGCYDEVLITCPKCGLSIVEQSKAGDCDFTTHQLEDAPPSIMVEFDKYEIECFNPDCKHVIRVHVLRPQAIVL